MGKKKSGDPRKKAGGRITVAPPPVRRRSIMRVQPGVKRSVLKAVYQALDERLGENG